MMKLFKKAIWHIENLEFELLIWHLNMNVNRERLVSNKRPKMRTSLMKEKKEREPKVITHFNLNWSCVKTFLSMNFFFLCKNVKVSTQFSLLSTVNWKFWSAVRLWDDGDFDHIMKAKLFHSRKGLLQSIKNLVGLKKLQTHIGLFIIHLASV